MAPRIEATTSHATSIPKSEPNSLARKVWSGAESETATAELPLELHDARDSLR
jgi:hypothetical protein